MSDLIHNLTNIGSGSIHIFWMPLLLWTIMALLGKVMLHYSKGLSGRQLYHSHLSLLVALPAGYLTYLLLHALPTLPTVDTVAQSFAIIQFQLPATVSAAPVTAHHEMLTTDTWLGIIELVLVIGIFVMLLRLIIDQVKLHTFSQKLNRNDPRSVSGISTENRNLIQSLRRRVQIGIYEGDTIPMTFGLFKPVIVLPDTIGNDEVKMNLVIRHELQHIRQHDYLRFWLIRLLRIFFWFHPLVWLLERDITMFREMDIDEMVISQNKEISSDYAQLLLDLAATPATQYLLPAGLAMRPSTVKKRITAMTQTGKTYNYRWISASLTILTLLIALVMGCSDMQNPDLSGKKLVDQKLTFSKPQITINDHTYLSNALTMDKPLKVPALGITFIMTPDYGTFLISGQSFDGAKPVGTISGDHLKFTLNNRNVVVSSTTPILPFKKTIVWVKNVDNTPASKNHWLISWAQNFDTYNKRMSMASTPQKTYVMENGKKVYVVTDEMPELIGGLASIQSRVQYPEAAQKAGIGGRVYVVFIVNKEGNVTDPKVIRGIGHGCDQAALNAVKQAKFKPGMKDGKPVNVRYALPIIFRAE
ncbi:MAG TPA: M56 family metallopeptidase [Balneolales bacterium]|nr:M56 family metallopeptidase [Balneolales bacterium]